VDTIRDFDSVFAVADADNVFGVLLMNVHCDFLKRVEFPDGSAKETMSCQVTDSEGFPDDIAGAIPSRAYKDSGGECIWFSDYWVNQDEPQIVFGNSYSQVVTPSGKAHATIRYAADPLTEEDCPPL